MMNMRGSISTAISTETKVNQYPTLKGSVRAVLMSVPIRTKKMVRKIIAGYNCLIILLISLFLRRLISILLLYKKSQR